MLDASCNWAIQIYLESCIQNSPSYIYMYKSKCYSTNEYKLSNRQVASDNI